MNRLPKTEAKWSTNKPELWTRWRRRAVDRRSVYYREWTKRRARLVGCMDHEPSVIENELLDQLTDRLMLSDAHRASRASQTKISDMSENRETALVARGETRRLMGLLGLLPNGKSSGFGGDEQPKRLADVLKPKAVA